MHEPQKIALIYRRRRRRKSTRQLQIASYEGNANHGNLGNGSHKMLKSTREGSSKGETKLAHRERTRLHRDSVEKACIFRRDISPYRQKF